MRHIDFSPFYRSTVGFDRLFSALDNLNTQDSSYPPYNIARTGEDTYRISLAVAGFTQDELDIVLKERTLTVRGEKLEEETDENTEIVHRGIAFRNFERCFQLASDVEVTAADLKDGLLHLDLLRVVPEEKKPRTIAIGTHEVPKLAKRKKVN